MKKVRAIQSSVFILTSVLGLIGNAQHGDYVPPQPFVESTTETDEFAYSAVSPSEALDLTTPLRFKPVIGVEMGFVSLRRSALESFNFVFDQLGTPLLNMDQLQGGSGSGLDTKLHFYNLFSDSKAIDVEMRFFQVSDMTFDQTVSATQVIPVFFNAVPATPVAAERILYVSSVRSFESNLVARTPWRIRLLGGFRYFELAEDFNAIDDQSDPPRLVRSRTRNSLGGGQIGAEAVLISNTYGKIWGSFKWAGLRNEVGGNAVAADPATGGFLVSILSGTTTTNLLDFELAGSLAITRSFSLYGGYQGLVADEVGLVTSQSRASSIFTPNNPITFDDAQWHGCKFGAVLTF